MGGQSTQPCGEPVEEKTWSRQSSIHPPSLRPASLKVQNPAHIKVFQSNSYKKPAGQNMGLNCVQLSKMKMLLVFHLMPPFQNPWRITVFIIIQHNHSQLCWL